jgi:transposase-like protein
MTQAEHRDISRKLRVLNHAKKGGSVSRTCRYFGISRETFYQWKKAYQLEGERALINSKPCPQNPSPRVFS